MDRFAISSGLMTSTLSQHISELRSQIGKTSTEATTGRYEDLTLHLSGQIGKAMLSQKALTDLTSEKEVLDLRSRQALTRPVQPHNRTRKFHGYCGQHAQCSCWQP